MKNEKKKMVLSLEKINIAKLSSIEQESLMGGKQSDFCGIWTVHPTDVTCVIPPGEEVCDYES